MQRFFFNRAIKKHIRKDNRKKQFVNFSGAKNILLLYECKNAENQSIQEIIFQLSALGRDVFSIGFTKVEDTKKDINQGKLVGKKDFNFLQRPKQSTLNEFVNRHFDLLIDLSVSENISLLYIALFANATDRKSTRLNSSH